jgi:hypothetical protein
MILPWFADRALVTLFDVKLSSICVAVIVGGLQAN